MFRNIAGWNRTFLLALGAAGGVLVMAWLVHLSKS